MNSWLVWLVFVIAFVSLGFVGYHFSVRTLRFFTAAFVAAVVVLVIRYGATHPAGAHAHSVNSFTRGFDDLGAALFQPLLPGRHIPPPGRIGLLMILVIIVVLVFAYRELEVWAMRWQPPTVDTSALGGDQPDTQKSGAADEPDEGITDGRRHHRLVAELRFRLPAVEVRAPAILPGGTRPNGLASIAENSGFTGSGLAGAIIRFFGMLWPNPRRYQVRVWIEKGTRSAGGEEQAAATTRVTVDLEDPRSGGSIATKTLVAHDFDQAASVVAGYVGRHIFKEDPTAPPWCVGSCDGGDLAAMLVAGQHRVSPESPDDVRRCRGKQISILETCRIDAGVARYELAQLHDLEGNHAKALRLHATNRADYPRFYRGRYRLGMSLEMIANPAFYLPDKEAADMRESLRVLDRCGVTDCAEEIYCEFVRQELPDAPGGKLPDALREKLLMAAQNELYAVRRQFTLRRVIWGMFWHRDERAIRKQYLRLGQREHFHDGARVAELLVAVRQSLFEEEHGCARANRDNHHAKRAMNIVAAITGDSAVIKAVLNPAAKPSEQARHLHPSVKKTRWLYWQCRTPSWQAAYNTACLYAALEQSRTDSTEKDQMADRVVTSLTRAVNDPDCEMERPWDWIFTDPDFSCLKQSSKKFRSFCHDQMHRDYPRTTRPASSAAEQTRASRSPAGTRSRTGSANHQHPQSWGRLSGVSAGDQGSSVPSSM